MRSSRSTNSRGSRRPKKSRAAKRPKRAKIAAAPIQPAQTAPPHALPRAAELSREAERRPAAASMPPAALSSTSVWGTSVLALGVIAAVLFLVERPTFDGAASATIFEPAFADTVLPEDTSTPASRGPEVLPLAAAPETARRTVDADVLASTEVAPAATATAGAYAEPAAADGFDAELVTFSGCLEADNGLFLLKDTTGDGAPRSRSWRTGFLRKRPAAVALVEASDGVSLSSHVGERVALTGILVDRDMQVTSLSRISSSCRE